MAIEYAAEPIWNGIKTVEIELIGGRWLAGDSSAEIYVRATTSSDEYIEDWQCYSYKGYEKGTENAVHQKITVSHESPAPNLI